MSDILIKGVEMPKDGCRGCVFVNRKWHGDICPFLKREVSGNVERGGFQTDCPLVSVPKHGRLIDADALYSHIKEEQKACGRSYECWTECQVALGFVNGAPTIIPPKEET